MDYLAAPHQDLKNWIRISINEVCSSYVQIGWYLNVINAGSMYQDDGYKGIGDYATAEYGISPDRCSWLMKVAEKFCEKDSPELLQEYKSFSISKLREMVYLEDAQLEEVKPETTVKEIREMKPKKENMFSPSCVSLKEGYPITYEDPHRHAKRQALNQVAKAMLHLAFDWFLEDYKGRAGIVENAEKEVKEKFGASIWGIEDGMYGQVILNTSAIELITEKGDTHKVDWFYLCVEIQGSWNTVVSKRMKKAEKEVATSQMESVSNADEAIMRAPCVYESEGCNRNTLICCTERMHCCASCANKCDDYCSCVDDNGWVSKPESVSSADETVIEPTKNVKKEQNAVNAECKDSCPPKVNSCRRQEWGTSEAEQEADRKDCAKCWVEWKMRQKVLGVVSSTEKEPEKDVICDVATAEPENSGECLHRHEYQCTLTEAKKLAETDGENCVASCCWNCIKHGTCGLECNSSAHRNKIVESEEITGEESEEEEVIEAEYREAADMDFDRLALAKDMLKQYSSRLKDAEKAFKDDSSHIVLAKCKLEVEAFTLLLESIMSERDKPETEQPELPVMKNNDQRKEFLDSYETWPIWIDNTETEERYYRYDLPDGYSIVVKVYFASGYSWCTDANEESWRHKEIFLLKLGMHFKNGEACSTTVIEHLKNLQKKQKGVG